MRAWHWAVILVASAWASSACAATAGAPREKGNVMLEPFDFRGVTIDGGPLRRQLDDVRAYYLSIPNDDLLKGFRQRAGLPAPGNELGGWYSADIFHVFGQIVSGLCRLYAATGDPACRDKANALVHGWGQCISADGFFYYSRKPNAPHYTYDKMVGGLVDAYLYTGNRKALDYLSRITDWAEKHLDRKRPYGGDPNEWYTLSENLYRAYLATGSTKYRDFARVWEYTEYWGAYADKRDIFGPRPDGGKPVGGYHAYSHVNTLGGAGAAYLVTGETRYLNTIRNAYDYLQANQCFCTGGYGPNETLAPRTSLLDMLAKTHNTFETQCGSWAAFKLARYLISETGDARYADWVERLAINGIGASIPMSADGRVFYYSDYNTEGAAKRNIDFGWSCCTGTRPMAVADYANQIYYHSADALCVALYAPSTVRWNRPGGMVTVIQRTRFPESDSVEFRITLPKPAAFDVRLRAPAWLAAPMTAVVDGTSAAMAPDSHHWMVIHRTWRSGDRLTVRLPMRLHASRFAPTSPYPAAIMRGPVALAVRDESGNPAAKIDLARLESELIPVEGEPLSYHVRSQLDLLIRPFYAVKEGEPYFLYLDPAQSAQRDQPRFSTEWSAGDSFHYCNAVGATVEYTFKGTGIRWLGYRFDDAGLGQVSIDDRVIAVVDQYGPGRGLPFNWEIHELSPGKHTIRIRILPEHNKDSKGQFLNVAGFEVVK